MVIILYNTDKIEEYKLLMILIEHIPNLELVDGDGFNYHNSLTLQCSNEHIV